MSAVVNFWCQVFNSHFMEVKVKGKFHSVTCCEGLEGEYKYSSTVFFNLGNWGGGGLVNATPQLPLGRVPSTP